MKLIRAVTLENEIEAIRFETEIRKLNIPYNIKTLHDSAYDGLYQKTGGYGYVEVEEENIILVRELYENLTKDNTIENASNNHSPVKIPVELKTLIGSVVIIGLIIVIAWLLIDNNRLYYQNNRLDRTETYYGEWNSDGTIYTRHWQETRKISTKFYDMDKNSKIEKIEVFDKDGVKTVSYVYQTKDDITTLETVFDSEGRIIRKYFDENNYGFDNRRIDYVTDTQYLEWSSSDNTNKYDTLVIHNNGAETKIPVEDLFNIVH